MYTEYSFINSKIRTVHNKHKEQGAFAVCRIQCSKEQGEHSKYMHNSVLKSKIHTVHKILCSKEQGGHSK